MSYEMIALLMFSSMMLMLLTGQRVFGAIGFVAAMAALFLWGEGGSEMAFSAAMKLEPFQRGMKELAPTVWITELKFPAGA